MENTKISAFVGSPSTFSRLPTLRKRCCCVSAPRMMASSKPTQDNGDPNRRIISDNVYDGLADAVGNTPLIKLHVASRETGCNVYGKAEFMNPGGSIKDRAALYLIKDAEEKGLLTRGKPGIIVESTGGNTGISLAEMASARGYKCIVVIPSNQSQDKKDALRFAGASLVQVPKKPFSNPNNYIRFGRRLADCLGAVYTNQFDNQANRLAHFTTTGPEIWAQLKGEVHGFSCAAGTGGTIAGTSKYLRSMSDSVKIALTDPCGAKLVSYFRDGKFKSNGESLAEGIGQERITANLEGFVPDYAFEVPDSEALKVLYRVMREEGLHLGTSSSINMAGVIRLGKTIGPGHTIVTVLCDLATRYCKKLYNPVYLNSRQLPLPSWIEDGISRDLENAIQMTKIPDSVADEEEAMAGAGLNHTTKVERS